jgi:hypothetical protein
VIRKAFRQRFGQALESVLYASALAEYVAKHQTRKITARLDAVYATEESGLDPLLRRAQARSLPRDSW